MNKLFSHKVFLQIFSVVILILMVNSYMINKNYKEYAYKSMSISLDRAIEEIVDINKVVYGMYKNNDFEKDYDARHGYIDYLDRLEMRIDDMFGTRTYPFHWFKLRYIWSNVKNIKEKGSLSKEDEAYLKNVHRYNTALINAYYRVTESRSDHKQVKQEYEDFIEEANKISEDEKYKKMFEYKVDK